MTILHIDASISGDTSASRAISRSIVDQLSSGTPIYRDLAADPLPHLTLDAFADTRCSTSSSRADRRDRRADVQFHAAKPAQGLDRPHPRGRQAFSYTDNGPEGLAGGKRVIVALARGGVYNPGSPAAAFEHLESYLRGVFNFIGIEPEFVAADGLAIGPEQRDRSIRQALR